MTSPSLNVVARRFGRRSPVTACFAGGHDVTDGSRQRAVLHELDAPSTVLLESQAGLYAARVLTARPTSSELTLDSLLFRALLLRWLRPPLTAARCRCPHPHDACGDHTIACPLVHCASLPGPLLRRKSFYRTSMSSRPARMRGIANRVVRRRASGCRHHIGFALHCIWHASRSPNPVRYCPTLRPSSEAGEDRSVGGVRETARRLPELTAARRRVVLGIEVGGRFDAAAAAFRFTVASARAREAQTQLQRRVRFH